MQLANTSTASSAQNWFMNNLPEIKSRSHACFARLDPDRRQEAMAEVMGSVFKASASAASRGVLAKITPYQAVVYATKQYRSGRRMAGYSSTDVMAEATRIKGRVSVVSLSERSMESCDEQDPGRMSMAETLADRHTDQSPLEQTRVNLDYAAILKRERVSKKALKVFRLLSAVRGCGQVNYIAHALKVSPGRICQLKNELARALAKHGYGPVVAGEA